ncbi:AAA family ATPase [Candidatus Woesearchaeota archaeon]|nr:AAA family ATPase [Candidatus Woesearchaeota archaeon]
MIKSDSELLMEVLQGKRKEISCVYGAPASGKTTLAKEAAIHRSLNNKKVVYIDSENSFNIERVMQLAGNNKEALKNIFVLKPKNLKEQTKQLNRLLKSKIDLVILDTIGVHYRLELKKNSKEANNEIHKQFNILSDLCSKGTSVLITNQIYQNFETKDISVVGGNMFRNWSKCLIKLEKDPRRLVLEKPEKREILFDIGNDGFISQTS